MIRRWSHSTARRSRSLGSSQPAAGRQACVAKQLAPRVELVLIHQRAAVAAAAATTCQRTATATAAAAAVLAKKQPPGRHMDTRHCPERQLQSPEEQLHLDRDPLGRIVRLGPQLEQHQHRFHLCYCPRCPYLRHTCQRTATAAALHRHQLCTGKRRRGDRRSAGRCTRRRARGTPE